MPWSGRSKVVRQSNYGSGGWTGDFRFQISDFKFQMIGMPNQMPDRAAQMSRAQIEPDMILKSEI